MSKFLTRGLATNAYRLVSTSVDMLLAGGDLQPPTAKRNAGHLRVSALVDGNWHLVSTWNFGEPDRWEHDYSGVAKSKMNICQRTGINSRAVQTTHRHLLEPGDTIYFGAVTNGSIVVSYSGVEGYFDELICKWLLATIEALIEHEQELQKQQQAEVYAAV